MGSSVQGGHLLHKGKGIHVPFDGQRWMRGMGEPLVMSCDIGHWHVFSRQHTRSRARVEMERDGGEYAGRALIA